jgi:hypothetical protein
VRIKGRDLFGCVMVKRRLALADMIYITNTNLHDFVERVASGPPVCDQILVTVLSCVYAHAFHQTRALPLALATSSVS